jgi:glucosamine--fructose-6-phosphate aminotransferase (isomerizing)
MSDSNLRREILEQPAVLGQLLREGPKQVEAIARRLRDKPPRFVLIAARGTSDNAATYGKYMLGAINGLAVGLAAPSLITVYKHRIDLRDALVIGVSQSGQGLDVNAVLEHAKPQGAFTVAITNDPTSPMAALADAVISLGVGPEKSVAASKTYTGELLALALLCAHWSGDRQLLRDLDGLAGAVAEVLDQEPALVECAQAFRKATTMVCVSRGYNHTTSFEIALKVKELSYIAAQAYSGADFRHGPIALLDDGFPVVATAPQGLALGDMLSLIDEIKATGARLAVVSNDKTALGKADFRITLPAPLPEWLSPIVCAIPGQFLALHLALARGYDPDNPRGLHKVTQTR